MINTYEIIEKIKQIKFLYIIGINAYLFIILLVTYELGGYFSFFSFLFGMISGWAFLTWRAKKILYFEILFTLFIHLKFKNIIIALQNGYYLPVILGILIVMSAILGVYIGLIINNKNRKGLML